MAACDPLGDLRAWQERLERLALRHGDSWAPPIDVYETPDAYVVTVEVPGLAREDVELAVEDSRLTIRGQRRPAVSAGATHFHQVERGHGSFMRTFAFGEKISADGVKAELADGVLRVSLPKVAPPPARKIEVQ